jgi:hypothetical protein
MTANALWAALLVFAGQAAQPPAPPPRPNVWRCAPADLPDLCRLADEDQGDRTAPIDWDAVTPRDRARRAAVLALLRRSPPRTHGDYFHAALVMQHGETWEDYAAAHLLSTRGLQLAPSDPNLQRMVAASWDRMMHKMGHRQWFGTNTFFNPDGTREERGTRPDLLPDDLIELWSRPWDNPE